MRAAANTTSPPRTDGLPPGPSTSPAVQTFHYWRERQRYMPQMFDQFGDIVTLRLIPHGPFVILRDPEHIREVFRGAPEIFHGGKGNWNLLPIVGRNSLLTLDAPEHKPERKRMMPPFHHDRIAGLVATMRRIAEDEARRWPVDRPFRFLDRSYALTLEIIVKAVLGVDDPERALAMSEALHKVADMNLTGILVLIRPGLGKYWPWRNVVRNLEHADRLIYQEIALRRQDPDRAGRTDVLSMLLEDPDADDRDVRDEVMTLLMAGHETTAVGLAWLFERLLRHPEAHARLRRGLDDPKDPYRTAVFKEALRVRPVIQNVARRLTEPIELAGYQLPAGATVVPAIGVVGRDERWWDADAAAFRPERWLDGNPSAQAWLPFGGGVRRCIGAMFAQVEIETVVAAILRTVAIEAVDPADEDDRMHHITMIPKQGTRMRVVRRLG
ncbi:cytochrome P450 [Kutzneria sp. 744]|uniref:cytochrome P450 n=1 Tax=Kutzneria sp. (strain 744) TaxID=345341 RepID=UPI0003EEBB24|nr:cytochrome P450 [Kutzneria sp. 744]EWM18731.1 P450 heme-thiolate protein [Kutzneria sp. 744]